MGGRWVGEMKWGAIGALTSAGPIGGYQRSIHNIKIWQDASQHRNDHSVWEHLKGELSCKLGWSCIAADS